MSKDKTLVPKSIDNAVNQILEKPTQNIGTTLADIWYLVFGNISYAAEKRKLKYSFALQEFEKELREKISKIPKDKLIDSDIQVIAPALEAAKFCIEKHELRTLFSNLIKSSLNSDAYNYVHPSFCDAIKQMSPLDAQNISLFSYRSYYPICDYCIGYKDELYDDYYKNIFLANLHETDLVVQSISISSLERLGLVQSNYQIVLNEELYKPFEETSLFHALKSELCKNKFPKPRTIYIKKGIINLTPYGKLFVKSCVS